MSKTKAPGKLTSFLHKTYEIVNDPSNAVTVAWTSDGMGFAIKSVPDFTEFILPRYFKHSNFASFVRQLNMYDFHKSREEGCENVFRHPSFLRGRKNLLRDIHRKSTEISNETDLSKLDCHRLLVTMRELQAQHQALEVTVQELRTQNLNMKELNHSLMQDLAEYKEREERLEGLLGTLSQQLQASNSHQDPHFKGHRHSTAAPLCLVESGQSMLLDEPEKHANDDSDKGERYEDARMCLQDGTAGLSEGSDQDFDAEMDRLLMPKT